MNALSAALELKALACRVCCERASKSRTGRNKKAFKRKCLNASVE